MTDDRRKRGKPDRRKINLGEPYEVAWWRAAFGVSKARLLVAPPWTARPAADALRISGTNWPYRTAATARKTKKVT